MFEHGQTGRADGTETRGTGILVFDASGEEPGVALAAEGNVGTYSWQRLGPSE